MSIHPGYAGATLELLLRHRAGLDHEMNRNDRWAGWQREHAGDSPTGTTARVHQGRAAAATAISTRSGDLLHQRRLHRGGEPCWSVLPGWTGNSWCAHSCSSRWSCDPCGTASPRKCPDMKPAGSAGRSSSHPIRPNMAPSRSGRRRASCAPRCPTCCATSTFTFRASADAAGSCSGRHSSVCTARSTRSHTPWAGRPTCGAMSGGRSWNTACITVATPDGFGRTSGSCPRRSGARPS